MNESETLPTESNEDHQNTSIPHALEKTKKLQTVLSGEGYIEYVAASARVSNGRKMTSRELDDVLMKKAIKLLIEKINHIRHTEQSTFVEIDKL